MCSYVTTLNGVGQSRLSEHLVMSIPPLLYSFRRCPYAIRARLALAQAGVEVHTLEVDLKRKPAALRAASPAGTVPVLVLPNGEVLAQSLDIMRWALGQNDPAGWLRTEPSCDEDFWIKTTDSAFKYWLDRYKYFERHPAHPQTHYRQQAIDCLLSPLEQALGTHGPWLGGARPVLADAAVFPFVRQFAGVEPGWWATSPFPATRAWLNAWLGSPLFLGVMRKQA
jgi:glutathione S-transferase